MRRHELLLATQIFECEVGGRKLVIETGKLATQADGAVTVTYGETVVLVTGCVADQPREGVDFLPLTIDYEERLYAAGKIPGGFIRREGRPSQEATLTSRLTDRPLRPLLPKKWRRDIQLIITVLSADQENEPDILALIGSSAVMSMSEVPFAGPVGAVHVGYINNELVLNPTLIELEGSKLDLIVASTKDAVVMVEAGASEISEEIVLRAVEFGHEANQAIIRIQEELQQTCGKPKEEVPAGIKVSPEVTAAILPVLDTRLDQALYQPEKPHREQALSELKAEIVDQFGEQFPLEELLAAFEEVMKAGIRSNILDREQRPGGRGLDEVRPLHCEAGLLPRTHGSALFSRGLTQVLTIATLGSVKKEQMLDGLGIEDSKRFIHHYNFPPFSTGEVKRVGGPGRREIGHGALAERALLPVLPRDEDFPYTIRLVSEVLSSNGSTSMASVCASSMSLMDTGIPVTRAVAGIAMGLVTNKDGRYVVLTDLEGIEDAYGDMDFKVAGTTEGITALQMDTKLHGISLDIVKSTLNQARPARLFILDTMQKTISTSRTEVSRYAPRMYKIQVSTDKIGTVIGPGGKTIRSIIDETKTTVDIDDSGLVIIGATDEAAANRAIEIIENLTKEVEVGSIYTGKVTRLLSFGAFVEILPGKEGMVHISELANYRVPNIEDEVKVGDEITVKVIKNEDGKIGLSRKAVFEKASHTTEGGHGPSPSRNYPPRNRDNRPPKRHQVAKDRWQR
ncbi:MAG: polyribonucleotide nucleotidyltransferase [Dehalococcoidales bacterium]|nr:MAG: polyribonucleotide nucleotidyltransferase [Dehalococcoidales bacterium]